MIWWCRSDPVNFSMPYSQIADLTLTLCLYILRRLLILEGCVESFLVICLQTFTMAREAGNQSVLKDLDSVKCALCLDIYEDPYRLPCNHVYVLT